jgi:hypothetical protein
MKFSICRFPAASGYGDTGTTEQQSTGNEPLIEKMGGKIGGKDFSENG